MIVQHQLRRGIRVVDGCALKFSGFDMIEGFDVCWRDSLGEDFGNLSRGLEISEEKGTRCSSGGQKQDIPAAFRASKSARWPSQAALRTYLHDQMN
ncbi:hypothetical protein Syun_014223 [Stephania yunnanensis]|uniref:Uncharacterized protein n=1 Tax=Stephania yunnanensis TaxID=152371 RepID=A0AAP0JIW9_9MAGN